MFALYLRRVQQLLGYVVSKSDLPIVRDCFNKGIPVEKVSVVIANNKS
jgi:hypothetical protein